MSEIPSSDGAERPRVLIVGAGFAGLNAACALRDEPVEVTLIDRNNYHEFQPLLYEVAMAGLEPDDIAHNVRDILRGTANVRFRMDTVTGVDTRRRVLSAKSGEELAYEYLIVAAGAVTSYFGVQGANEHAFPLKNLSDAVELRTHVLRQFERYDRDPAAAEPGALVFVLVGGGPTGVEMAGAFVELLATLEKDFPDFEVRSAARVVLLEMQPELLPPYARPLRSYTRRTLEKRGVEVRTETVVERIAADAVHLAGGETIPTETLIWTAGIEASPLGRRLHAEQTGGGRVPVESDLSLPDRPDVFVAGDMAGTRDEAGELHPQVAQVAIQQGRHAARQILARIEGRSTETFTYRDYGQMATIGRNAAVAEFPSGIRFKGLFAWLVWVVVHIYKLVGFRNRISVFMDWIYNYFTYDRHARLIVDSIPQKEESPDEQHSDGEHLTPATSTGG